MDRLSAVDLSTMWPDDAGWPQDVGLLGVLAQGPTDGSRHLRLDAVQAAVGRRLDAAPRLRQVVRTPPLGLGRPVWVDDPGFRLADHVRVFPVLPPGGEEELVAAVEEIRRVPLDRSRPLWQLWMLAGRSDGGCGFYLRVHHALADGEALAALVVALMPADQPGGTVPTWRPAPPPTTVCLLTDNVRVKSHAAGRAVAMLCGRPADTVRRMRAGVEAALGALAAGRGPRTSITRRVGPDRRTILARARLDDVIAAAHQHHATVNDVLLTAVAGGLRDLLTGRGEPTEGLALRAIVPVSLHRSRPGPARGNVLGQVVVRLPVGAMAATSRLRLVSVDATAAKRRVLPRWAPVLRSRRLRRAAMALAARQRSLHVYVTDVRGPREPLSLAGAPVTTAFPVIALMGNLPLGVGAISYAGQLNVTVTADPVACPDLDRFVTGMDQTLRALTKER